MDFVELTLVSCWWRYSRWKTREQQARKVRTQKPITRNFFLKKEKREEKHVFFNEKMRFENTDNIENKNNSLCQMCFQCSFILKNKRQFLNTTIKQS